jgi:hypothetical protein
MWSKDYFVGMTVLEKNNMDIQILLTLRYLYECYFVKKIFFETGPLKLNKFLTLLFAPFSILVNVYIMVLGFKRNKEDVFIRAFYAQEICVQFSLLALVIGNIMIWPKKRGYWMK